MNSSHGTEIQDKQAIVSEFLQSETQKIYMGISSDPSALSDFMELSAASAASDAKNRVFLYEIWDGEHSRHFLFRWLWDTVSGVGYRGNGSWSDIEKADPQLINKLRLLTEKDIRPLEIRFMEAIRFIAGTLTTGERLVLCFVPRAGMQDRLLVEFFQAMLRVLPPQVKLLIGQGSEDVLARQADFCPSNRLILTASDRKDPEIEEKYREHLESGSVAGRLLDILSILVHPAGLDLLAKLTGEGEDSLDKVLRSPKMPDLVESYTQKTFRLKYPQAFAAATQKAAPSDTAMLNRQSLDFYRDRLTGSGANYLDVLSHSICLHRVEDPEIIYGQVLDTYAAKLKMGGGDICELEIGRGLSLLGEEKSELQAELLLRLGEIREERQRNEEAIDVLDSAIEKLKKLGKSEDLQLALELKGRAAFAIRDIAKSKAALEESLSTARQMGREDLCAGLLSQIGYLHYSTKQLAEAEEFYRESLDLYTKIAEGKGKEGQKGIASQWSNLGHTSYARGDFQAAETNHRKALEIFESIGDAQSAANQWGYIGHTFFAAHSYEKAVKAYERAAELEEERGEPEKAAQRYAGIGHSMYAQRKADLARGSFKKALDRYTQLGNPDGRASQLSNLGLVEGDQAEYEAAVEYFNQAAQIYREMGDVVGETGQTVRIAHVRRAQKQDDEAIRQFEMALKRYREIQYSTGEGDVLTEMGRLYSDRKDWRKAGQCFDGARSLFAKIGHREKEALSLMLVAYTDKSRGAVDAALSAMQQAMEIYKKSENSLGVANVVSQLGLLHYEQKNFGEAERLYRDALDEFRKRGDAEGEANLLCNLGTLYYQTEQLSEAKKYYQDALEILRKLNHPAGIAGLLMNMSFVSEQEGRFDDAAAQLKEARELYGYLQVPDQMALIDQRMAALDEKAAGSLKKMRSEFSSSLLNFSPQAKSSKIGPNAPCPCASGKKYKKCCAP